ncbi:MAG: geranylgeranyl reductase family protein [Dehalococcoidia bacterium]
MDDVVVVGAGPAGNNAALELASRGFGVRVIDSRVNIGDKLCTGIIGAECARRFPLDSDLVYHEARSAKLVTPEKATLYFSVATPQAKIVDRVSYVASFAHRAEAAGATYHLGQRVLEINPEGSGVSIRTDQNHYRARSVIIAAGFGTPLTNNLGLGKVADFVTAVQAEAAIGDEDQVEVHLGQKVAPGFFSWIVPTRPGRALVGLLTRHKAQKHMDDFLRRLESEGRIGQVIKEPSSWGIPLRPLKHTLRDRILVVGDAAGQVKPTTGGGIYYSLLSSEIAADVLAGALSTGDLSSRYLSSYQRRWKELLGQELETGYSARRMYEYMSDNQINSLARQADRNGLQQELINSPELSFDWHSQMIDKVMHHPMLGGMLGLVNPLLATLAHRPNRMLDLAGTASGSADPLVSTRG